MPSVAVIGTTSWGTTLAIILAQRGIDVALWARSAEEAAELQRERQNRRLLPGFSFPAPLQVIASCAEAVKGARMVVFAVPSATLRENLRATRDAFSDAPVVLNACKGLERESGKRMSQVLQEELPESIHPFLCTLSGPNLAVEVAAGKPASAVVAAEKEGVAMRAQELLMSPTFRVYTNTDVVGVELAGALKNIIALGAGMSDGLGYGDNAKAAFITRGLVEITRLGVVARASPLTFAGLAGMGDLVATCSSRLSRNHYVGEQLALGRPLKEVLDSMVHVAEGVDTTVAARRMAALLEVDMPITEATYRVLFEELEPRQAVAELMGRAPSTEWSGIQT